MSRKYLLYISDAYILIFSTTFLTELLKYSFADFHVERYIRINCNSDFIIAPHKHIISWGDVNNISKFFYRNAILVFWASLCDEITKEKKIIIKGYKHVLMEIGGEISKDEDLLILEFNL